MEELRKLLIILVLLYKNIWKSLNTREYYAAAVYTAQYCTDVLCKLATPSRNTNFSVAVSGAHTIGRVGLHGKPVTHYSRLFWPNSVIGLVPTGSGAWLGSCAYNCCLTLVN